MLQPADSQQANSRLVEELQADTKPVKLEFLLQMGLTPVTMAKKEENARKRTLVEEEKIRRHYRMLAKINRKFSPRQLYTPKSEAAMKAVQQRKLREMNTIPIEQSSTTDNDDRKLSPKTEQVPYQYESTDQEYVTHQKSLNKYSFKRGHSLKSEFRFATPLPLHRNNQRTRTFPKKDVACTVGTQVDPSAFGAPTAEKSLADLKNAVDWPNLEAIMEVFYRHQNEVSSEKVVLSERWQQLRQKQDELKQKADALSRQMSDLLRTKRELDDERQSHENSIEHLKKCLRVGR